MKWKEWMAGFKAFSGIHTTGCVFHFFSFISPQSGRRFRWNISRRETMWFEVPSLNQEGWWGWRGVRVGRSGPSIQIHVVYTLMAWRTKTCAYTLLQTVSLHINREHTINLNYIFYKQSERQKKRKSRPALQYVRATVKLCSMETKQMHVTYGLLFSQIVYNVFRNMHD